MIRHIVIAAALAATPALVVAAQPTHVAPQAQDTSKAKPKTSGKTAMHHKGGKTAHKTATPKDTTKAK